MRNLIDKGFLYIACGERKYIDEAIQSAKSLLKQVKNAHISLITDNRSLENEKLPFSHIIYEEAVSSNENINWKEGLTYKVRTMYDLSPYEKTIFLDSDTYIVDNCNSLFDLLDYHDLCLAHAPADMSKVYVDGRCLPAYTPYNSGVILFNRNNKVETVFKKWFQFYSSNFELYITDQQPLMEALINSDLNLYVLSSIWNARTVLGDRYAGYVKIIHGRHKNLELVNKRINQSHVNRIWLPQIERSISAYPKLNEILPIIFALFQVQLKVRINGFLKKQ